MTTPRRGRVVAPMGNRDEGGYVLVMLATAMFTLVVAASFAVDIGGWYARAAKIQRAADAAALSGRGVDARLPHVAVGGAGGRRPQRLRPRREHLDRRRRPSRGTAGS